MPNRRIAGQLISWIGAGTAPSWPVHICSSGEWLRSRDRLREARERLWVAEEMFAEIGMEAFAERTRGELVAAGAKPRVHPAERARGPHTTGGADRRGWLATA